MCNGCNEPIPDGLNGNQLRIWRAEQKLRSEVKDTGVNIDILKYGGALKVYCHCLICNHKWWAEAGNIRTSIKRGNSGCKVCAGHCSEAAKEKFLALIKTRTDVECLQYDGALKVYCHCLICNHKWWAESSYIRKAIKNGNSGCLVCSGHCSEAAKEKHLKLLVERRIKMNGEYNGALTKTDYECLVCNYQWSATPNSINKGSGCPCCSVTGFDPTKPCYLYFCKWTLDGHSFLKFGITNLKFITRIKQQQRKTKYQHNLIKAQYYELGQIALDAENQIKNIFGRKGFISKELMPDGYTETVEDTPENLQTILNLFPTTNPVNLFSMDFLQ